MTAQCVAYVGFVASLSAASFEETPSVSFAIAIAEGEKVEIEIAESDGEATAFKGPIWLGSLVVRFIWPFFVFCRIKFSLDVLLFKKTDLLDEVIFGFEFFELKRGTLFVDIRT